MAQLYSTQTGFVIKLVVAIKLYFEILRIEKVEYAIKFAESQVANEHCVKIIQQHLTQYTCRCHYISVQILDCTTSIILSTSII